MDRYYVAGVQAALEKLGGSFLGRLTPAMREAAETTQMLTRELPSKAGKLVKPKPKVPLEKMKFLRGSTGPY
jgi:inhibitor of KinA sporulation pathway (predicted exonuclease)